MSIGLREFHVIARVHGLAAAEACAAATCGHRHDPPPAAGPAPAAGMADLRCPESMGKLLGRTQASALPGGAVELACSNCSRRYRAAGVACTRVLHRFNLLGDLLCTEIIP